MTRRITLADVAKACGVSTATVSNALADKDLVAEATKDFIRQTAARMGYRTSSIARALRTGHSGTVGVVVSNLGNPFYSDILIGLSSALTPKGYQTIICNTESRPDLQEWHVSRLIRHMVDGMVLLSYSSESDAAAQTQKAGIPLVTLWRRTSGADHSFVGMDDRVGMRMALDHLWGLGHRRIALIRAHSTSSPSNDRQAEFLHFHAEHGQSADPAWIVAAAISTDGGEAAARDLLLRKPRPSAILVASDLMAVGVMREALRQGLDIPRDLSIITFEDSFVAGLPHVMLTSVSVPRHELGRQAGELLLQRIAEPASAGRQIVLPPGFVIRDTTAPPRSPGRRRPG